MKWWCSFQRRDKVSLPGIDTTDKELKKRQFEEILRIPLKSVSDEDRDVDVYTKSPREAFGADPIEVDSTKKISELLHVQKTPEEKEIIRGALQSNDFLGYILTDERITRIVNAMSSRSVKAKEIIIKQGGKGSEMFISCKGTFQFIVHNKIVEEFSDNRVFGELAILYSSKRSSTVKAVTGGKVWVLDRHVYQTIVSVTNIRKEEEIFNFLHGVDKLNTKSDEVLRAVSNLASQRFFASGTKIIREGDRGDFFYIIRAGTVTISKNDEFLEQLDKSKCFGELALQNADIRLATVVADPPGVDCLVLNRTDFLNYFGDVKITDIEVSKAKSLLLENPEYLDIKLSDLNFRKTLGIGAFGRVELWQHKKKKSLVFALKKMSKANIVLEKKQKFAICERNIQMNMKSEFIVRLYRTYRDKKYVYFLMEPCMGGDLFSLMDNQKPRRFSGKHAKFIAGCMVEAFDYMHVRGVINRDLKPENIMIAKNGYFKLTDFGFAKKIPNESKTYTFVGTPEYVAPEMLEGDGHNKAVDYWTLGILIFELLTGRTPFRSTNDNTMFIKIVKKGIESVSFPGHVNPEGVDIIKRLCRQNPNQRLGMSKDGVNAIRRHPWFRGLDWKKLASCKMTSPFVPILKSPTDTTYFPRNLDNKKVPDPKEETSGWDHIFDSSATL